MSLTDNPNQVVFASPFEVDKIIGTYSGEFSLPSLGVAGTNDVSVEHTTNIDETTLFQGIYSVDNGTTWNSFQTHLDHADRTQGEISVWGESTAGTFTIKAQNVANFSATVFYDYTVLYKVALIAKPDQGDIDPQPIGTDVYFDSRLNYQKIAVDSVDDSSGTNLTVSVSHDLGYIPKVRSFRETAGVLRGRGFHMTSTVAINESTVDTYIAGTTTCIVYTRIYYDE